MKIKSSLKIALAAFIGFSPFVALAGTSGVNTASHVKAMAPELEGEKVSLDVVFIRVNRHAPDDVPYVFFWAATIDEDEVAKGGAILVVADKEDKDTLIRRYGTNLERDRGQGPESKTLRGTVRLAGREDGPKRAYIDITDAGVDLTNSPDSIHNDSDIAGELGVPPGRGPKGKGFARNGLE
ncbi:hypothetical protein [Cerasicoccus frondis]|uniref:hypothetical protein n=1 Tax=Cerasicoccus frondis TaxID=490090 RepID=UPI002852D3C8|nr:hypothetical protein [Cerasicoccus frondis]